MATFLESLKDYLALIVMFATVVLGYSSLKNKGEANSKDIKEIKNKLYKLSESDFSPEDCAKSQGSCKAVFELKIVHILERIEQEHVQSKQDKQDLAESLLAMEKRMIAAVQRESDERSQVLRSLGALTDELRASRIENNRDRNNH